MKKHKTKIIATVLILAVLAGAWFLGGPPATVVEMPPLIAATDGLLPMENIAPDGGSYAITGQEKPPEPDAAPSLPLSDEEPAAHITDADITEPLPEVPEATPTPPPTLPAEEDAPVTEISSEPSALPADEDAPAVEMPSEPFASPTEDDVPAVEISSEPPPTEDTAEAPHPNIDEYIYNEGPAEPEPIINDDGSFTVTLTVRADTLIDNMHLLDSNKHELVPEDGIIFPPTQVTAYEGESVFNILQREMRRARIHMASRFTPIFNSAYVEAINNIYAYDAGPLSGWIYSVNGHFLSFGSSLYILSPGNLIEWVYTVDLGRDLGADWQR